MACALELDLKIQYARVAIFQPFAMMSCLNSDGDFSTMDCETEKVLVDPTDYKMICEQCGSMTITLPLELIPSPQSVLTCGRCGAPRGTLQSLRDRSNRVGLK